MNNGMQQTAMGLLSFFGITPQQAAQTAARMGIATEQELLPVFQNNGQGASDALKGKVAAWGQANPQAVQQGRNWRPFG